MTDQVKTSHGLAIIFLSFVLVITLVSQSWKDFTSVASTIISVVPARSQLAALDGAGSGLVGWWKFDEGSGTTAGDSSGGGNNGTFVGNPGWVSGKFGQALDFHDANVFVNTTSDFIGTSAVTVCAWIYPRSLGVNLYGQILGNGYTILDLGNSLTNMQFRFSSNGSNAAVSGVGKIVFNKWSHICASRDANGVGAIYVDGQFSTNITNTGTPTAGSHPVGIGDRVMGSTHHPFDGLIDDVRVYNRVLSVGEVSDLYAYTGETVIQPPPPTGPTNQPPVVSAGSNQSITLPSSVSLSGTATDDGLPSGSTLINSWTMVSGPGTVTFSNQNSLSTNATFSTAGVYVLRLTSSDSLLIASSDITITVNPVSNPQGLSFTVNSSGLQTLSYEGLNMLNYRRPAILNSVRLTSPQGTVTSDTAIISKTLDSDSLGIVTTYSWGNIHARYQGIGNKLAISLTVNNTSPNTLSDAVFEPMDLELPSSPPQYNGSWPLVVMLRDVPVQMLSYSGGSLAVANDDLTKSLSIGFPVALDGPTSTIFPFRVYTGIASSLNAVYYGLAPAISAGGSATYSVSMRFGQAWSTPNDLAGDIYAAFRNIYPYMVNWPDRRAIGMDGMSGATGTNNPRGWFNLVNKDYVSTSGLAQFRTDLLARADAEITVLRYMNAQGVIFWDLDNVHGFYISYGGDPRKIPLVVPEMNAVVDEFLKKYTDAGLKIGMMIRPQMYSAGNVTPSSCSEGQIFLNTADSYNRVEYVCRNSSWVQDNSAQQQVVVDYKADMLDKIRYAVNRWGASLFYIDSYSSSPPYTAEALEYVLQAYPNILLIPERYNSSYYSASAPFITPNCVSCGLGYESTAYGRLTYPQAFSVIRLDTQSNILNQLITNVRQGDILLMNSWFMSNNTTLAKQAYEAAGVVAPPSTPISGSCSTTVNSCTSGTFSDVTDSSTNYLWSCLGSNGGTTASCSLPINTSQPDSTAPVISITSPSNNSTISGTVNLSASASDPTVSNQTTSGISTVQFRLDGSNIGSALTTAPYSGSWNTVGVSNGNHVITAIARDVAGNTTVSSPVNVNINNTSPYIPPVIPPVGGGNPTNPTLPVGVFTPLVTQRPVTTPNVNSYIPTYSPSKPSSNPPTSTKSSTPTTITRNLKLNDQGTDVLLLQKTLNSLGYTVATSSKYTETTKQAVIQYQTDRMLSKTGILDNTTLFLINIDISNLHSPKAPTATSSDITTDTNVFTIWTIWDKILAFIIYILNMIWKFVAKIL